MGNSSKCSCAALAFVLVVRFAPAHAQTIAPEPYASIATDGEGYAGPGRAAVNDLAGPVIRIGILAPLQGPRKSEGDSMVAAAQMALHDVAPRELVHGHRVALAIEDSSGSWGLVSDSVIRLALKDEAVALITSTSGTDAHLSEQVGNRIGVPVLTLSADATTTEADVPWIFRMGPSDDTEAQLIAHDLYIERHLEHILLITQHGHDGDRGAAVMRHAAGNLDATEPTVITLDGDQPDLSAVVKAIGANIPQAIVIWTDTAAATRLLPALRAAEVKVPCYFPTEAASEIRNTPAANDPVAEVWTVAEQVKTSTVHKVFASHFQQVNNFPPNSIATRTYDAVTLIVRALQVAGLNRARVRDQLSHVHAFDGMSGEVTFDREGNNLIALHLVKLQ